ncbi:hypothetical protein ACFQ0B_28985 [Nonomuraea thailandensis]
MKLLLAGTFSAALFLVLPLDGASVATWLQTPTLWAALASSISDRARRS